MPFRARKIANGSRNGSPRTEVGEIDTTAPFQSVKAAVSLFGEVVISKESSPIRRSSRTNSLESVLDKETQLLLAQTDLTRLKEELANAKAAKARAISELEDANLTLQELNSKHELVIESIKRALEVAEAIEKQHQQLDAAKSRDNSGNEVSLQSECQQIIDEHTKISAELDEAKQALAKIRQDYDAAQEAKLAASKLAVDVQNAASVNTHRISKLSEEIKTMKESRDREKLAYEQAQKDYSDILAEKDTILQTHRSALEEAQSKVLDLKEELDSEMIANLDDKLAETTVELIALQEEMEKIHAADMEAVKIMTQDMDGATRKLEQVTDEESLLRGLMDFLKLELEKTEKEQRDFIVMTARTKSSLQYIKLEESKALLQAAIVQEIKKKESYGELVKTLRSFYSEARNAENETEEMKTKNQELVQETETACRVKEATEKELSTALKKVKDAKDSENNALNELKILSETMKSARSLDSTSASKIRLSKEEYEHLRQKAEGLENVEEMRLSAAKAQFEAIDASRTEAETRASIILKEIDCINKSTEDAQRKTDRDEAAKRVLQNEIQKWRQQNFLANIT